MAKNYNTFTDVETGDIYPAATHNQLLENVENYRVPPMCRLTRSTNQTIANSTVTVVAYDAAPIDTDSMATTGASAKITANTAGVYAVGYTVLWGNTSTAGYRQAWVTISGSGRYAGSTIYPATNGAWFITGSDIVELSASQYVDLRVTQASGGNETIGPFASNPIAFYAYWIGQVS